MRPRVLRGALGWLFLLGGELLLAGGVFAGAFAMFRIPSIDDKNFYPELDDVVYAVPGWLSQVGWTLIAAGIAIMVVAWLASPPWHEGIELANTSAQKEILVGVLTAAQALTCAIVAFSVSWNASPVARGWGLGLGIAAALALVTVPVWLVVRRGRDRKAVDAEA